MTLLAVQTICVICDEIFVINEIYCLAKTCSIKNRGNILRSISWAFKKYVDKKKQKQKGGPLTVHVDQNLKKKFQAKAYTYLLSHLLSTCPLEGGWGGQNWVKIGPCSC